MTTPSMEGEQCRHNASFLMAGPLIGCLLLASRFLASLLASPIALPLASPLGSLLSSPVLSSPLLPLFSFHVFFLSLHR